MKLSPCGFYGDPKRECRCSPNMITKTELNLSARAYFTAYDKKSV